MMLRTSVSNEKKAKLNVQNVTLLKLEKVRDPIFSRKQPAVTEVLGVVSTLDQPVLPSTKHDHNSAEATGIYVNR
jgi:hypothetical protein